MAKTVVLIVGEASDDQCAPLVGELQLKGLKPHIVHFDRRCSYTNEAAFVDDQPSDIMRAEAEERAVLIERQLDLLLKTLRDVGANLNDVKAVVWPVDRPGEGWKWLYDLVEAKTFPRLVAAYTVRAGHNAGYWLDGWGFGESLPREGIDMSDIVLLFGKVTPEQYKPLVSVMARRGLHPKIARIDQRETYTTRADIGDFVTNPEFTGHDVNPSEFGKIIDAEVLEIQASLISRALGKASLSDVKAIVFPLPKEEGGERWEWLTSKLAPDIPRYDVQQGDNGKFWLSGEGFGKSLPPEVAKEPHDKW